MAASSARSDLGKLLPAAGTGFGVVDSSGEISWDMAAKSLPCSDDKTVFFHVKNKSLRGSDLTPAQCRMARAALELGVRELAGEAKIPRPTR